MFWPLVNEHCDKIYFCTIAQSKARKTMTKTRKFVVNGVVMTSQTSRIVGGDDYKKQQEHVLWCVFFLNYSKLICISSFHALIIMY